MAIATTVKPKQDEIPTLARRETLPPAKTVVVDSHYEPHANLLQYVSGARWIVTYYKQLKHNEEASEGFNYYRPEPYQQYLKINQFEIRVSSPLSFSPNSDTSTFIANGVGLVYPSIVPDHGDTFVADIGDGRLGLFNIENVTQKSHLRDTVYEIEYNLINWLSHDMQKTLDDKVVKVATYERSYLDYGANPILDSEQHGIYKDILVWQERIARHYFNLFFSNEYDTFLVPGQNRVVYDPYLVEFIKRLWTENDIKEIKRVRAYNRDNVDNLYIRTLWDVIINIDLYGLKTCSKYFGIIPKQLFKTGLPSLVGITYSRMDYIYHPISTFDPVQGKVDIPNIGKLTLKDVYPEYSGNKDFKMSSFVLPGMSFTHPDMNKPTTVPDAKKLNSIDTYVLSEAFYNEDKMNMTKLERMLYDVLDCKTINASDLLPILKDCINWGSLEQFYYIPLLVAMSRMALGDLSQ